MGAKNHGGVRCSSCGGSACGSLHDASTGETRADPAEGRKTKAVALPFMRWPAPAETAGVYDTCVCHPMSSTGLNMPVLWNIMTLPTVETRRLKLREME